MNYPILISTFTTVFLAELGDKTQLATVALSGSTNRPLAVFLGSSTSLVLASLLGVVAGGSISRVMPEEVLKIAAALGLVVLGLRLVWPMLTQFTSNLMKAEVVGSNKS